MNESEAIVMQRTKLHTQGKNRIVNLMRSRVTTELQAVNTKKEK